MVHKQHLEIFDGYTFVLLKSLKEPRLHQNQHKIPVPKFNSRESFMSPSQQALLKVFGMERAEGIWVRTVVVVVQKMCFTPRNSARSTKRQLGWIGSA
jgi:hypothetical protein